MREAHRQLAGGRSRRARGGPGALTRAMADSARAAGAVVRTDSPVERIVVRNDRVVAVVATGRSHPADIVISSADPKTTFLSLLDATDLAPEFAAKVRNYRATGTMAKLNLALASLPAFRGLESDPAALAGRIHIGHELTYLEQAFDHAKYGEISRDPWLDITIPSLLDSTLAPPGGHVVSIYVHYAPHRLRNQGWEAAREPLLQAALTTLERYAPGVSSLIVEAQLITPTDMEREYSLSGGHVFHGELAPDQLFAMRPVLGYEKYDSPVAGLHLCGAGTHPGGFMTGASGRLCARAVLRKLTVR
jgi:phytoene dehydrogenase-like protein